MMNVLPLILAQSPVSHVINHPFAQSPGGYWLWSANQGNLILSGILIIVIGLWAAAKIKTGAPAEGAEAYVTRNRFAHMLEVICSYLREEIARPLLGARTEKLMPFLWTIFFFVLTNNLLGLVPLGDILHLAGATEDARWIGGTATQNLYVTAALALVAGVVFNLAAIFHLGPAGFAKHMLGGLPVYMLPVALLLFLIEFMGQFIIKPGALAIRLFANMTGGHVLLATILMFAGQALARGNWPIDGPVTIISIIAACALMFLELFVAFLQAFVFMFLTTVFISLMDHHDEHDHEHEHGHATGHEHAHA